MADVESAAMSTAGTRCSFCGHDNPTASKYCNECAADLQLALCPACSAVNKRGMPGCHKCGASLGAASQETTPPSAIEPATVDDAPARRRPHAAAWVLVGLVCVVAAAVAAYRAGVAPLPFTASVPIESADGASAPVQAPHEDAGVPHTATDPAAVATAQIAEPESDQRMEAYPMQATAPPGPAAEPVQQPASPERPRNGCTDAVAALSLCDLARPDERK